jgi:Tol biopolymer transport system component
MVLGTCAFCVGGPAAAQNGHPEWSPDGSWVAFRSDVSGDSQIWIMRADGTRVRMLTRP